MKIYLTAGSIVALTVVLSVVTNAQAPSDESAPTAPIPVAAIQAGFTEAVPIEDSGEFAFTLEGGGGVRIFTSDRRAVTLGLRLHHISNGDRYGSNRGLNQFVFYAGFSVFK